jgi:hypothetical protein
MVEGKILGRVSASARTTRRGQTLRHFCRLVESALELLFEVEEERWRFALGTFRVAALSRLELVRFRGPARTDFILLLRRRPRRQGIVAHAGFVVRAMVLNL